MTDRPLRLHWAFVGPALALAAGLTRWLIQGSGNLYTATDKRFYLPDPDLGWRLAPETYHWLGLDRLAAIAGFAAALALAAFLIRRRERKKARPMPRARLALVAISPLPLAVPILALAGGAPPEGARDSIPGEAVIAAGTIEASLPEGPAGTYRVLEHPGTLVAATIRAGKETFEARFAGGPRGTWRGDPRDLAQPMTAEVFVDAASIDTGIDLRNKHARGHLETEEFAELGFELTGISGAEATGEREVAFAGEGTVQITGQRIPTDVNGTVTVLDAAARERLGVGTAPTLVVNAELTIQLEDTAIDTSGGTFDANDVPIRVSLILIYEGKS